MKKNLLILASYSSILLISEILYRITFNITPLYKYFESFLIIFILLSLYFFAKYRISQIIIILFFICSTLINNLHQAVYLNWINGTNYYLMIKEWYEVANFGIPMISRVMPNIIWSIFDILVFISIAKFRKKTYLFADILFYLSMIYIFIRSFDTTQEFGITSNPGYSRIKSNYYSFGYFIGKVLPYEIFKLSDVKLYTHKKPKLVEKPKVKNIILIMGESASAHNFSTFGYKRDTSPFLTSIQNQYPSAIVKEAYSAGLMTAISLPSFFNAIPYPNGLKQIVSGRTNLFHLAKEAGFNTYFYSAQGERQMMIISLMGKTWIDDLRFPTNLGYDNNYSMNDHKVLPWFKAINLNKGNNFIVLHQRGSHGPYGSLLEPGSKKFKGGQPLDDYDSTIYDTDTLIKEVFQYLKSQSNQDWVLIYTSDHGQFVSNQYFNQGTGQEPNYVVPALIYSPDRNVQKIEKQFEKCKKMYHQQLSTFMIDLLGFDMPISDCKSGTVNWRLLTGDSGYYKMEQNKAPFFINPRQHTK